MSRNQVIGLNNQLPWHMPADLAHFKKLTLKQTVVMGRRTFESIGKPLSGRHNIILTHNTQSVADTIGTLAPHTTFAVASDLKAVVATSEGKIFIIGGATLYQQSLDLADELYLTVIDHHFDGDTFFPERNPSDWHLLSCEPHPKDEKNPYPYRFMHYKRASERE